MDLKFILRLLHRNGWAMVGTAVLLTGIVFLINRSQWHTYTSSATIYYGDAAGFFQDCGEKSRPVKLTGDPGFSNLINLIHSREVAEETGIRLMAQHLILSKPDPEFCSPGTWNDLMINVPREIWELAWPAYPLAQDTVQPVLPEYSPDTLDNPAEEVFPGTENKQYYTIRAGDNLSQIATKFHTTVEELQRLNNPMPPLQGGQILIVGTNSSNNESDTLIPASIGGDTAIARYESKPALKSGRMAQDTSLLESLVAKMIAMKDADQRNFLFLTLRSANPFYSIERISKVEVRRLQSSNLLKLTYQSEDPAVCRQTLNILTSVLANQLNLINARQTGLDKAGLEQSQVQVIDRPEYPDKTNGWKSLAQMIGAFLAGLILTGLIVIAVESLNRNIKSPRRLRELSGLEVIGAFPRIPGVLDSRVNYPLISSRAIDHITQRIKLEDIKLSGPGERPFLLFVISTCENEGKTFLATRIIEKLRASGLKVLFLKPREVEPTGQELRSFTSFEHPQQAWDYEYDIPDNFMKVKNINELLRNYTFVTRGYHYVVIELPALLVREFPALLAGTGDLTLFTCLASRAWSPADTEALKVYCSAISHPVRAVLNDCHPDRMYSVVGDIPRRRS